MSIGSHWRCRLTVRRGLFCKQLRIAGAATFLGRALDPEWTTLVF